MECYVGLDVSLKQTSICVVNQAGSVVREGVTQPAQRAARHYSECIMRSRLTARDLANFLREYARARPELQRGSVQRAMNDYLNALCGRPLD
jgi:hypothetical protein